MQLGQSFQMHQPGVGDPRIGQDQVPESLEVTEVSEVLVADNRKARHEYEVLDRFEAGIVLTGGTSKMEGVVELAEEIFHMPVRIGSPQDVRGLNDIVRNPIYATSVGLLHYGIKHQTESGSHGRVRQDGFVSRLKSWFQNNF